MQWRTGFTWGTGVRVGRALTKEEHVVTNPRAETNFREGVQLLEAGLSHQALSPLKSAIEIQRLVNNGECREPRYLSHYGLSLCLTRTDYREALCLCRTAARLRRNDATIWWNLGRVAMTLGRRGEAHRALTRALKLSPCDQEIVLDIERLGLRRSPVLSFLPRQNPVNIFLGKLRFSLRAKREPAKESEPAPTAEVA